MALINCPECGRENVSDNAESCPNCGYGIKNHFVEIRKAEEQRQREIEQKKREQERQEALRKQAIERSQQAQRQIESAPSPEFPVQWIAGMIFAGLIVALGVMLIAIDSAFFGICMIVFGGLLCLGSYFNFKEHLEIYKLSKTNMNAAKSRAIAYEKSLEATRQQNQANREARKLASMYKCPQCGKQAGKPIGVVSKSVSVGTVGLASNKIGKSYKCSSCGYMW